MKVVDHSLFVLGLTAGALLYARGFDARAP